MPSDPTRHADTGRMTSDERRKLADRIERYVWPVVKPATRDDIDLGQLRVNILDAIDAALYGAHNDGQADG